MLDSNNKNVREGETRMLLIKRQEEKQKHNLLTEQVLEQLFFFCFPFRFPRLTEALFSFLLLFFLSAIIHLADTHAENTAAAF